MEPNQIVIKGYRYECVSEREKKKERKKKRFVGSGCVHA